MFASSMKILTSNTYNASPTTAQNDSGSHPAGKVLNCGNSEEIGSDRAISGQTHKTNKRDQKHNNKTKFAHGNSNKIQQHITQQHLQQTQKYRHKNNNANKLKNQNYGNSSNTCSVNRKKYYQQPQTHQHCQQQQQYITAVQKSSTSSPTNVAITNNNNSSLVKNQNYNNTDLPSRQQQPQLKQLQQQSTVVNNLANFSTNLTEAACTCLLQPHNCDELSLPSFPPDCSLVPAESEQTKTSADFQSNNICHNNRLESSSAAPNLKTSLPNEVQTACITCWKNFDKLPDTTASYEANNNNNKNILTSNCDTNENLVKFKSSIVSSSTYTDKKSELSTRSTSPANLKRKSFWKNSNTSAGVADTIATSANCSLSASGYSLKSTAASPKLLLIEKQRHESDNSFTLNAGKDLGKNIKDNCKEEKYSAKLAAHTESDQQQKQISKYQQTPAKEKIEMTTPLSASNSSSLTAIETSASSNTNTLTSKTSTQSPKTQPGPSSRTSNDSKQMLKALTNNINCSTDINKSTTTSSSLSKNTSSVASSQNSYTLDFLHSVGVKMAGVAIRSPDAQGTTKTYENQPATSSSDHNACLYTGISANQRQSRYMYNGSNANTSNNGNQLPHYHHHHHQPSQLTIASFLHKDLLGGGRTPTSTGSSRGNSSSNSRNTNHYHDRQQQSHYTQQQQQQHQTTTRYQHNYNTAAYQQQSAVMQHTNYGGGGGGGGYNGGHRSSGYAYTNYHNANGETGMGKGNTVTQLHTRQLKNSIASFKNSANNAQVNKKSNYASSTTSNGSLSSAKSFSSNSSNISNRQLQTISNQDANKGSTNLNLAIETLPSKMQNSGNHRAGHRGHLSNHHSHHHANQHLMMNSPNVLQHQNYYNLTYVTTDASANSAIISRDGSPASQSLPPTPLPATNCNSPKALDQSPGHAAMLMNFSANQLQYPRYQHAQILAAQQHQQFQQFQQQHQTNISNKNVIVPLSLSLPSPTISNSHQAQPHNIICCSQLDEATTAAAAAAASSSSSSGIIAGNDYDSDNSSSHSSTQIKYQSLNSVPSLSSSTSSVSMKTHQVQKQPCLQPATAVTCTQTTPLHSPLDYCGTSSQVFSNMQVGQQSQLPQFYGTNNVGSGTIISLLNMPTKAQNNFSEGEYLQQQLVLSASHSQRSPDHFNIAVSNHSNNSSGYWSPSFQNNQFIYHKFSSTQTAHVPPIASSSSSCGSSSASISPRLPNDDIIQQQSHQRLANSSESGTCIPAMLSSPCSSSLNEQIGNIILANSSKADSAVYVPGSSSSSNSSVCGYSNNCGGISINTKRSSSQVMSQQKHRLTAQLSYQSSSSSSSSLSNATASTLTSAVRTCDGVGAENVVHANNGCNSQLTIPSQNSVSTLVESSSISGSQNLSAPAQHFYSHHQSLPPSIPPHNLLYNHPQVHHIRALNSSSVHDFFSHTPPDRFLARAHLIEAKEAPASLLKNSKWDHLSQGIWKKFINSQQTEKTFKQKMRLWRYLYVFIKNAYPRYGLYLVGSTISGFGSDSSDVDMCLVSRAASSIDPRLEALFNLTVLRDYLSKSGQFENFNLIEAKVPILRFTDRMHQLEVDLNFNNCVGIKNTHLLYCYSQLDWRLRPLVLVTKLWAQYHDINNAKNMTISSYSLVLMVIHFLQYAVNPPVLPCLHELFPDKFPLLRSNDFGYVDMNETIEPYESKNTQAVGELFLLFLEYYSFFDYTQFAISVRTGGLLPINVCRVAKSMKNDVHQWKELCIEEPFDLTNTARSVYDFETFERVKAVFLASWRILQETLDLNSVFTTILLSSPSFTDSSNVQQRTSNSSIYTTSFHGIEASSVNATDSRKDFSPSGSNNGDSVVDDGASNLSATNNSLINTTNAAGKMCPTIDLNRTLTPRHHAKEFVFSPTSSSSTNSIKTSAKNLNGNNSTNNNRTVPALAS